MEAIQQIHNLSKEIASIELEILRLREDLYKTTFKNILAHICIKNKIELSEYNEFMGKDLIKKIDELIKKQIFEKSTERISFNWQGDISYSDGNGIRVIESITELKFIIFM